MVQIYQKDDIVSETSQSVRRGHRNYERKDVVDERVKRFICECAPRQRSHRFQTIIDEQLGQHKQESKGVHAVY